MEEIDTDKCMFEGVVPVILCRICVIPSRSCAYFWRASFFVESLFVSDGMSDLHGYLC